MGIRSFKGLTDSDWVRPEGIGAFGVRGHARALELGDPAGAGPSGKAVTCHRTPNTPRRGAGERPPN